MGQPAIAGLLALLCLGVTPIMGQKDTATAREEVPRFAVSSIKPSRSGATMQDFKMVISGPNVEMLNCTLGQLLLILEQSRYIEGGPGWIRERRFDIRANSEEGTSPNNRVLTQMTLQLLKERFKLAFHLDSKGVAGLALTVGRKQPNLVLSKDGEQRGVTWGSSAVFTKFGMLDFARALSDSLDTVIVDRTDLKGEYDFTLPLDEYRSPDGDGTFPERLRSAVEGFGFKFVSEKVKVDFVTIDHAELPDEN
jgi:uncharacterized protein (TIGR03435 family)